MLSEHFYMAIFLLIKTFLDGMNSGKCLNKAPTIIKTTTTLISFNQTRSGLEKMRDGEMCQRGGDGEKDRLKEMNG